MCSQDPSAGKKGEYCEPRQKGWLLRCGKTWFSLGPHLFWMSHGAVVLRQSLPQLLLKPFLHLILTTIFHYYLRHKIRKIALAVFGHNQFLSRVFVFVACMCLSKTQFWESSTILSFFGFISGDISTLISDLVKYLNIF